MLTVVCNEDLEYKGWSDLLTVCGRRRALADRQHVCSALVCQRVQQQRVTSIAKVHIAEGY